MKRLMVLLATALFALGLPAAAVASTAHATRPAVLASTCGSEPGSQETYYLADNDSFVGGFWLHAHAFNQPVTTITTGNQTWYTCNGQRWTNPAGQIVDVAEVNLVGGDSCLNWAGASAWRRRLRYASFRRPALRPPLPGGVGGDLLVVGEDDRAGH